MRGDLVSRPIGEVLAEAERLLRAGVRELLVISQDTSAYGVDVRYRTGFWQGRPVKTRMTELAAALDALGREHGAWVRLHYVYPYPHVDEAITRMTDDPARGGLLPYLDVPFQHASPRILKLMKRPANAEGTRADRGLARGAADLVVRSTFIVGFRAKPRTNSKSCSRSSSCQLDRSAVLCIRRSTAHPLTPCRYVPEDVKEERRARFMSLQAKISRAACARVRADVTVLVDGHE